ncbi:MAG: endonuclease III domain-containing protein [Bacillota bacterium]
MFGWREPDLPPFAILLAELLLRKTKADMVERIFPKVLNLYPTPKAILGANIESLTDLLRPLGLQAQRARALYDVARHLEERHGGEVPRTNAELLAIPHVGRYIANACLCFAFGHPVAVVDVNVMRVLGRVTASQVPKDNRRAEEIWQLANALIPHDRPREFNFAMLDLGATTCIGRLPRCTNCPIQELCRSSLRG